MEIPRLLFICIFRNSEGGINRVRKRCRSNPTFLNFAISTRRLPAHCRVADTETCWNFLFKSSTLNTIGFFTPRPSTCNRCVFISICKSYWNFLISTMVSKNRHSEFQIAAQFWLVTTWPLSYNSLSQIKFGELQLEHISKVNEIDIARIDFENIL